jgi:hypothetical protein
MKPAGFAKRKVEPELLGDESRLIRFPALALDAQDLLKRNNVGINGTEHVRNAPWPDAPVQTSALMNVVGCDADLMVGKNFQF